MTTEVTKVNLIYINIYMYLFVCIKYCDNVILQHVKYTSVK